MFFYQANTAIMSVFALISMGLIPPAIFFRDWCHTWFYAQVALLLTVARTVTQFFLSISFEKIVQKSLRC